MKYVFSLYVMLPVIILFSLCNGILFHSVSNNLLFIGTAIVGFGAAVITIFYGAFIQGEGVMFVKGARAVGFIMYGFFILSAAIGFASTYSDHGLHDQTIKNLRYVFSNVMFAFGYGVLGLIWSLVSTTYVRSGINLRINKNKTGYLSSSVKEIQ